MTEKIPVKLVVLAFALAGTVLVFDLSFPLGVAGGVPYVLLVLLGVWFPGSGHIFLLATAGTALTILGYFLSPAGGTMWVVLANRGLALFVIWTTAILVSRSKASALVVQESEVRLRSAFENLLIGNVVINHLGFIEVFNAAAEKIFGYSASEVIGRNISLLMPEPDRTNHDQYIQDYLQTGQKNIVGLDREVTGLRKNGDEFPMHLGIGEMVFGGNKSFVGSIRDLTDVRELESQLRRSQRLEAVGQLTGGIAHDFNNLLAVIVSHAEHLEQKLAGEEDALRDTDEIRKAVNRGTSLTQRLLAFSRNQPLSPVSANIFDLINDLEEMLKRTLGETITVNFEGSSDLWPAMIDPHQLENALLNLAINARDAMPEGGRLTIDTANVSLDDHYTKLQDDLTPGDFVRIAVSDTGSGMPTDILEKVFEPFFTTKEFGKGSGLGLSMVYGFVKQSNGHVSVYSEVGHGSIIRLYLPRSHAVTVGETANAETHIPDVSEPAGKGETILLVEDDQSMRLAVRRTLMSLGYAVLEASDGETALELASQNTEIDVLLSDVVLGRDIGGPVLADKLLAIKPDISVLLMSGYTNSSALLQGELSNGHRMLNKPFTRAELAQSLRSVIDDNQGIYPALSAPPSSSISS